MENASLLVIDPQNDFARSDGSLFVKGADADMRRLSDFVTRNGSRIGSIRVTLDLHRQCQIFHPAYWRGADGLEPAPFTAITGRDMDEGRWMAGDPGNAERARSYLRALERDGRYGLTVWPYHCLFGSEGAAVHAGLFSALRAWERDRSAEVDYLVKGRNRHTEHYSALRAEVPDPEDGSTAPDEGLVEGLRDAELVYVAGEALDYCVYNTIRDLLDVLPPGSGGKFVMLEDCTSAIDPASIGRIRAEFGARGVRFAGSGDATTRCGFAATGGSA